jgi:hypothetical protein
MGAYRSEAETRENLVDRIRSSGGEKSAAERLAETAVRNTSERIDRDIRDGKRKS